MTVECYYWLRTDESDYLLNNGSREVFYIPHVLLAHNYKSQMKFYHEPKVLQRMALLMRTHRINLYNLNCNGWEVTSVVIPKNFTRKFIEDCQAGNNSPINKRAKRLCNLIRECSGVLPEESYDNEDNDENYWI